MRSRRDGLRVLGHPSNRVYRIKAGLSSANWHGSFQRQQQRSTALVAPSNVPVDISDEAADATAILGSLLLNGLDVVNGNVMARQASRRPCCSWSTKKV